MFSSEAMYSNSRTTSRPAAARAVTFLVLAAALAEGCDFGLHASGPRDAVSTPSVDAGWAGNEESGSHVDTGSGEAPFPIDGPSPAADVGDRCATIVATVTQQCRIDQTCTAVVRVDYASLAILSHALVCGRFMGSDEVTARAVASSFTFPGGTGAGEGTLISGALPKDEWVFLTPPSDLGGAAAVNARNAKPVFAGSTINMGTGEILFPSAWDTRDLGSGCAPPAPVPIRTLALAAAGSSTRMTEAANAVLGTALFSAFWQWGCLLDVMVLLYPRTIDPTDPKTTEFIVLVNGGWLD